MTALSPPVDSLRLSTASPSVPLPSPPSSSTSPALASPFASYAALRQHVILTSMASASSFSDSAREGYRVDGLIASLVSAYLAPVPLHLVLRHSDGYRVQLKVDEKPHPTAMFHHLHWIDANVRASPRLFHSDPTDSAEEEKTAGAEVEFPQLACDGHRSHSVECCRGLSQQLRRQQRTATLRIHRNEWRMLGCLEGERLRWPFQQSTFHSPNSTPSTAPPPPSLPFSPPFFAFTCSDLDLWNPVIAHQRLNSFAALRLFLLHHRHQLPSMDETEELWRLSLPPSASPFDLQVFAVELAHHLPLELFYSAIRLDVSAAANEMEEKEAEVWRERMEREENSQWHCAPARGGEEGEEEDGEVVDDELDEDAETVQNEEEEGEERWCDCEGEGEEDEQEDAVVYGYPAGYRGWLHC